MARTISSLVISIFLLVIAADQNDQVDENESLCLWSKPCAVQQHPSRTKLHENASAVTPFLFLVVEKLVMLLLLFSSFFPHPPYPQHQPKAMGIKMHLLLKQQRSVKLRLGKKERKKTELFSQFFSYYEKKK